MAEWHINGSAFTFSNVLLMLWCLYSNTCLGFGRTHRRAPFCEDGDAEATVEQPMSFLWAIKRDPPSYFFGTIHVPYTRVWDYIPENTKRAFEVSEQVFFELDLTDPYTISALTQCQLLPHGKNLSEVLPRDIYRRLKRHLDYVRLMMPTWLTSDQRDRGLYADYLFNVITGNWERKRPVWVMLMVNSLTESDIKSRGIPVLDLYLAQEAERRNKKTGAVEEVEEQCVPLNGLNISQVVFALNQTLHQQESVRAGGTQVHYTTDDLIKHYNCGDLNTVIFNQDTTQVPTLVNATVPPMDVSIARKIDEYFREELICKRNKRMGERVMELLIAHPGKSFFFAFGAGHFLGNYTVLDVVQNMGFEVEHIAANQKIKPHKSRPKTRAPTIPEFSLLKEFSSNSLNEEPSSSEDEDLEEEGEDEEALDVDADNDEEESVRRKTSSHQSTSVFSSGGESSTTVGRRRKKHKTKKNAMIALHSAPSSPTASAKHRNFNDLWVRLDSRITTTRAPKRLPQEKPSQDSLAIQRSLRVWYGLPNAAVTLTVTVHHLCLIPMAGAFWTFSYAVRWRVT